MSILIGADFVPTKSNQKYFCNGDVLHLIGKELQGVLEDTDYRIFNLEVPLVDHRSPIDKCGPNLIAPTSTIYGYKKMRVNLLTLANNHILDQGEQGLKSTMQILKKSGISYLGAGDDLSQAIKPFSLEVDRNRIGIYACTEHEFSVATKYSAGANPYDPLESFDHVKKLKERCNFVIILYHGGKEHYRYPSPDLQRVCRKFIDRGAGLVVCQHTHCIGCEEKYHGGTIVYGQGNFLFDRNSNEFWNTGMLIRVNDDFSIKYIPLIKMNETVRLADNEKAEEILKAFFERSSEIIHPENIEKRYYQFAKEMREEYLSKLSGKKSLAYRVLNKITCRKAGKLFLKQRYNRQSRLAIQNCIECEAHRELLAACLKIDK